MRRLPLMSFAAAFRSDVEASARALDTLLGHSSATPVAHNLHRKARPASTLRILRRGVRGEENRNVPGRWIKIVENVSNVNVTFPRMSERLPTA